MANIDITAVIQERIKFVFYTGNYILLFLEEFSLEYLLLNIELLVFSNEIIIKNAKVSFLPSFDRVSELMLNTNMSLYRVAKHKTVSVVV